MLIASPMLEPIHRLILAFDQKIALLGALGESQRAHEPLLPVRLYCLAYDCRKIAVFAQIDALTTAQSRF